MLVRKLFLTIGFLFSTLMVLGQGFVYTFTDPCTFKTKEIVINNPAGNVVLIYNGQIQSFTQTQLTSGALEQWINQINTSNPSGPCSGVALYQNTTMNALIAQNNISVLTSVMSALNEISSIGGSNITGIVEAKEKSASSNNKKNNGSNQQQSQGTNGQTTQSGSSTINGQNQNNGTTNNNGGNSSNVGTNQTNQQSQTNNGNGSNSTGTSGSTTGTNQPQSGGNGSSNNTTQGGSTTTQSTVNGSSTTTNNNNSTTTNTNNSTTQNNNTEDKLNDAVSNDARNSSSVKAKVANAKQGGILLTGDLVLISSASGNEPQQFKFNMSVTKANTNNTFVKGALLNFTSSINNSNLTLFTAYRIKGFTGIVANSSMLNFDKDFFNTTSLMTSYKYKMVTSTLGINYTTGNLGRSKFQSISCLGGAVGNFNLSKKISNTTMLVTVYSPFVYYYEGLWYKSGWLLVPYTAFDYRMSQKFKLNLSFSGVQQFKDATINYQVLLGAKALL